MVYTDLGDPVTSVHAGEWGIGAGTMLGELGGPSTLEYNTLKFANSGENVDNVMMTFAWETTDRRMCS